MNQRGQNVKIHFGASARTKSSLSVSTIIILAADAAGVWSQADKITRGTRREWVKCYRELQRDAVARWHLAAAFYLPDSAEPQFLVPRPAMPRLLSLGSSGSSGRKYLRERGAKTTRRSEGRVRKHTGTCQTQPPFRHTGLLLFFFFPLPIPAQCGFQTQRLLSTLPECSGNWLLKKPKSFGFGLCAQVARAEWRALNKTSKVKSERMRAGSSLLQLWQSDSRCLKGR